MNDPEDSLRKMPAKTAALRSAAEIDISHVKSITGKRTVRRSSKVVLSVRTGAGYYRRDSLRHDRQIRHKRHAVDVLQIQLDPLLERDITAAIDLP